MLCSYESNKDVCDVVILILTIFKTMLREGLCGLRFFSFRLISQTLRLSACHPSRMLEREFLINIATLKIFNRLGFLRSCNVAYFYIKKSSYFSYFSFEITFSHRRCHRNSVLGWSNSNKNENRRFSLLSYRNVLFCYQRSSL